MKITQKIFSNIKTNLTDKTFPFVPNKADEGSFTTPFIKRLKNRKEINELVNRFIDSFTCGCGNITTKPKGLEKIFNIIERKFLSIPFKISIFSNNCICEGIKSNGKIQAGYVLSIDKIEQISRINFLTIAPDIKKTKQSAKMLINMAKRIEEHSRANNCKYVCWSANKNNDDIQRIIRQLPVKEKKLALGEKAYLIKLEDFENILQKFS